MKNSELCEKCRRIAGHYADEVKGLDEEFNLLAELCLGFENLDALAPEMIASIGNQIAKQLDQRLILQHYFLGRTLCSRALGTALFKGELARLRATWEFNLQSKRRHKKVKKNF